MSPLPAPLAGKLRLKPAARQRIHDETGTPSQGLHIRRLHHPAAVQPFVMQRRPVSNENNAAIRLLIKLMQKSTLICIPKQTRRRYIACCNCIYRGCFTIHVEGSFLKQRFRSNRLLLPNYLLRND